MIDWKARIVSLPDACHGKPCIRGTRVMASSILGSLAAGFSRDDVLANYPGIRAEPNLPTTLDRALALSAHERGQVFDELFDSLAGHDSLDGLMDELERRGALVWEPGVEEIERRVRSMEEQDPSTWRTAGEAFAEIQRRLEARAKRADSPPRRHEPRLTGRVGDLAGAALELPPPERAALARAILDTIEPSDEPGEPEPS